MRKYQQIKFQRNFHHSSHNFQSNRNQKAIKKYSQSRKTVITNHKTLKSKKNCTQTTTKIHKTIGRRITSHQKHHEIIGK